MDDEDDAPTMEETMAEAYDRALGAQTATDAPPAESDDEAAPAHWPDADRELLARLDGDGRRFVLRRHREMEADYTRKMQALAEQRRTAEAFAEAARPYEELIAGAGGTPVEVFRTLLHTAPTLRTGTAEQKAQQIAQIARRFGVHLARAPTRTQGGPKAGGRQAVAGRIAELQRFRNAAGPDGRLLHPEFDRVATEIGGLLGAGRATSLADAYERATWAHPETRRQRLAAAEAERVRTAQARVGAARRSVNVRSGATQSRPTRGKSIEETMAIVYDRIHGKEAD